MKNDIILMMLALLLSNVYDGALGALWLGVAILWGVSAVVGFILDTRHLR